MPSVPIQPFLQNEKVILAPLRAADFEALYDAACDPKIWEQHPNKDRWKKDVFKTFFQGALQSQGAFTIIDKKSAAVIGSTRFYDYDASNKSILIGYTFYRTQYWGTGFNRDVKCLMLDYIFQYVDNVYFHVGSKNIRSQVAITKLGATKVDERNVAYFGEDVAQNFIYCIEKSAWQQL